jgi:phage tail protein X
LKSQKRNLPNSRHRAIVRYGQLAGADFRCEFWADCITGGRPTVLDPFGRLAGLVDWTLKASANIAMVSNVPPHATELTAPAATADRQCQRYAMEDIGLRFAFAERLANAERKRDQRYFFLS